MSTGTDLEKFFELVGRSELVDETDLGPVVDQWRREAPEKSPAEFAKELVERRLLTSWQADNLLKGKHKGFILGNYRLLDQLGRGGMSTVYLAEHRLMKRRAAIKVLPRHRVEDRSYLGRFRREAQATAALDHMNIVRVYDIAEEGKTHYIAMEFVDGKDLLTLVVEQGPMPFTRAADYIAQAAVGLQHAHNEGLIHRDVKPANLLAAKDGVIKVLDLGLAKFDDDSLPSLTLAHEDNVLGTVDYLAPEQAVDSHQVDYRADIYSLGCTLYFLLTGHPPFPKGTLAQRVVKHQREEPPAIRVDRPDVPLALEDLCRRMMIKDPDQRIGSAQQVAEELVTWLKRQGADTPAEAPLLALLASGRRSAATGMMTPGAPGASASFPISGRGTAAPIGVPPHRSTSTSQGPAAAAPSAPTYGDEDLELAVADDFGSGASSHIMSASSGSLAKPTAESVDEEQFEAQVNILEQELVPLEHSSHDSLLSGERIRVERRLQPSENMHAPPGTAPWVWWTVGTLGLLVLAGIVGFLMRMS
ncbi:MAG: serine/threonine-protein kinase [Pirellulales bacterium]